MAEDLPVAPAADSMATALAIAADIARKLPAVTTEQAAMDRARLLRKLWVAIHWGETPGHPARLTSCSMSRAAALATGCGLRPAARIKKSRSRRLSMRVLSTDLEVKK